MAEVKRKIEYLFINTCHENKLSKVVKSIERWVMNALKREKNDIYFLWNAIAQKISEICGISKWHFFNIKGACFSSKSRNKIYLPWKL